MPPTTWKTAGPEWRKKRIKSIQACRERRIRKLKELAGGRCHICGYSKCFRALEFHHIDPSKKAFAISQKGHTRSLESGLKEVAKCILLCANCHREVEDGLAEISSLTIVIQPGEVYGERPDL